MVVNGHTLDVLIDSCSSDNFIREEAFKNLNVSFIPSQRKIIMALTSMESSVVGSCVLSLLLNGQLYQDVKLDILKNLCCDIILEFDFQKMHKSVIF